jgi:hypothetical protein
MGERDQLNIMEEGGEEHLIKGQMVLGVLAGAVMEATCLPRRREQQIPAVAAEEVMIMSVLVHHPQIVVLPVDQVLW